MSLFHTWVCLKKRVPPSKSNHKLSFSPKKQTDPSTPPKNHARTTSGTTYSWQSIPSPGLKSNEKPWFRKGRDLQANVHASLFVFSPDEATMNLCEPLECKYLVQVGVFLRQKRCDLVACAICLERN